MTDRHAAATTWSLIGDIVGELLRAAVVILALGMLTVSLIRAADAAAPASDQRGGLLFRSDKPDEYYLAPILATEVEAEVNGTVVRATVRQHFVNPSNAWLEGIYVYPLPEGAAVDRLTMRVGDRLIDGEIRERAQAEAIYRTAAAEGRRASLVSGERPNIFTTSVANIGPGEEIVVEIGYQDAVRVHDGSYSLRLPLVVGPRYIPAGSPEGAPTVAYEPGSASVPDAARITPPVLDPSQGPLNPVTIRIVLDAGFPLAGLDSLYHPVRRQAAGDRRQVVTLAGGSVPADRDFVLEWQPEAETEPAAAAFAEERNGDSYLLVTLVPPAAAATAPPPRDVVFVIDTSGSMAGESIDQAKAALAYALDRLTPADRFNIIRFANDTEMLFPELVDWTPRNLEIARAAVDRLHADGGTEMRPALRLALAGEAVAERLQQVVFLTDAAVGNEAELFRDIAGRIGQSRLFTVGIGSAPNSYFMRKAAELGRGSFTHIGSLSEVKQTVTALLRKLERPLLTDISVSWSGVDGRAVEMFPKTIPDLYDGEPVTFAARVPETTLGALTGQVAVAGRRLGGAVPAWTTSLTLAGLADAAGVASLWARAKLTAIEDGLWQNMAPGRVESDALAHALAYDLVSAYTSLVAVDQTVVRPYDRSMRSSRLPTNLPHGWVAEKVFGTEASPGAKPALPAPERLLQRISFEEAAAAGLVLPKTATPMLLHLLIGAALLGLALACLAFARRRHAAAA